MADKSKNMKKKIQASPINLPVPVITVTKIGTRKLKTSVFIHAGPDQGTRSPTYFLL
jgi:hypothetical protein